MSLTGDDVVLDVLLNPGDDVVLDILLNVFHTLLETLVLSCLLSEHPRSLVKYSL